jgi:hypothetical protein
MHTTNTITHTTAHTCAHFQPATCPGSDPDLPTAIAELLHPFAVAAYQAALAAAFTAGADARRKARDAASRALEEAHVRLQLYAHGCEGLAVGFSRLDGWVCRLNVTCFAAPPGNNSGRPQHDARLGRLPAVPNDPLAAAP